VGRRWLLKAAFVTAVAIAVGIACTHGSYEGSGSPDGGTLFREVGRIDFRPGETARLPSSDGAFLIRFSPNAFAAPTKIRIERLEDRVTQGLTVPRYRVIADPPLPIQPAGQVLVTFYGNEGPGEQQALKLVATIENERGEQIPLPIGVRTFNTPRTFGSLTTELGTFSISHFASVGFAGTPDTCMRECCAGGGMSGPSGANFAISNPATSCHCTVQSGGGGGPGAVDDSSIFNCLQNCRDISQLKEGCEGFTADLLNDVDCRAGPDSGLTGDLVCNPGQFCCVSGSMGGVPSWECTASGISGGNSNGCGGGIAVRCAADDDCKPGYVCCYDPPKSNEYRAVLHCAKTCAPSNRACTSSGQCGDAGACAFGAKCSVGKCGSAPDGCQ
jgi:hypothetical protein